LEKYTATSLRDGKREKNRANREGMFGKKKKKGTPSLGRRRPNKVCPGEREKKGKKPISKSWGGGNERAPKREGGGGGWVEGGNCRPTGGIRRDVRFCRQLLGNIEIPVGQKKNYGACMVRGGEKKEKGKDLLSGKNEFTETKKKITRYAKGKCTLKSRRTREGKSVVNRRKKLPAGEKKQEVRDFNF